VWKEYREHRAVWLTLAVLAVGSLVIAAEFLAPEGWSRASPDHAGALAGGALILAAMYGLVCGAMMFAGERESRSMLFLDTLPVSRAEVWWAKCLLGIAFTLLYSGIVVGVGVARGFVGDGAIPVPAALLVPLLALEAFAWGLCASTFCRTVLTAVALAALVPLPVLWLTSGMCLAAGSNSAGEERIALSMLLPVHGLAGVGALVASLVYFADRDFEKRFVLKPSSSSYGTVAPKRQPGRWEVLLWLALRQGVILAAVLTVLAFFLGLSLPTAGAGVWPVGTLFLGVACGTAVFMGEQAEGAFKFWGDQRLPVAWLWLRRTALWAGVGATAAGLMLLSALLHVAAQERGLPNDPHAALAKLLGVAPNAFDLTEPAVFLLAWLTYGFALGQLCALVWRKSAVAVVVAVLASAGTVSVWGPSLLGGGLHAVQVLGVPLLVLVGCRLALWDWVTDRLKTRPAALRLIGALLLAGAWVAGNLALRVLEAPGGGPPFDLAPLQVSLADPEQLRAGAKILEALKTLSDREKGLEPNVAARAGPVMLPANRGPIPPAFREQVPRVIEQGWAAADPRFQMWLEAMTAEPWPTQLGDAAAMPLGVFIHPRNVVNGRADASDCVKGAQTLAARAIATQARGGDDKALDYLATVLALSRHLRHHAPAYAYGDGLEVERIALLALDHGSARLAGRPELLRRALDELARHESATPPVTDALAAEYLRFRGSLGNTSRAAGLMSGETEAMLMQVPWEAERARRLSDAVFAGRRRLAEAGAVVPASDEGPLADWLPASGGTTPQRLTRLLESSWIAPSLPATAPAQRAAQLGLCRVRGARLQLALALYQREHGKAAPSLEALVPALLPELPDDPFAHQPFHYRLSTGERIAWPRDLAGGGVEFVREVAAGQGIVWSVGPDGTDDGGTRQLNAGAKGELRGDVIFLVPQ
jgi:ABC-type transport system involved in multi-copper enzyme maturation permease subunit